MNKTQREKDKEQAYILRRRDTGETYHTGFADGAEYGREDEREAVAAWLVETFGCGMDAAAELVRKGVPRNATTSAPCKRCGKSRAQHALLGMYALLPEPHKHEPDAPDLDWCDRVIFDEAHHFRPKPNLTYHDLKGPYNGPETRGRLLPNVRR